MSEASCLTSRLGAVRYMREVLIPRLQEKGVPITVAADEDLDLLKFVRMILDLDAVDALVAGEFPPSCRKNIAPCLAKAAERKGEAIWADGFEQFVRTLLTGKLYIDAQNEGEIAEKMAAIQRLAQAMEYFFAADALIYDFVGGVREALGAVARYTKDAEVVFAAAHAFGRENQPDVDEVIALAEEGRVDNLREILGMEHLADFNTSVAAIQAGGAR